MVKRKTAYNVQEIFQKLTYESDGYSLPYRIYVPKSYDCGEMYPLMVFLHGAGERGDDLDAVLIHGPLKEIRAGHVRDEFILLSPQCGEDKSWWDYSERLYAWMSEYVKNPFVDEKRVYLTGNSMGGFGTWAFAMSHPELFAAIVPVCGGGMSWYTYRLIHTPVWAFHCVADGVVPCEVTIDMVGKLKMQSESEVRLTIYPECSHDAWTATYQNQEVYDWLLTKTLA